LCIQVLYSNSPYNVFKEFVWDPTEPVATRPLVFRYAPNSLNLFYAFDGNKNVSDVFYRLTSNGIGAHYDYAPFGATTRTHRDSTASFDIVSLNPFRFSSEYYDSELDLVYYNYRHYSPGLGRFLSRDPIEEQGGLNLYAFVGNCVLMKFDVEGKICCLITIKPNWFEDEDHKSWGGHSILTCGEGGSTVGSAYISYFPKDKKKPESKTKHQLDDDVKKYGLDLSTLPKDGSIQTTSKGFEVSQLCFSTDCVDIQKVATHYRDVFNSDGFAPWELFGNNCADNAAAAIAASLPPQEKPKCRRCEMVYDLLLSQSVIVLPTWLEDNMKKLKANNCQRYVCRKKPE
ncbi:MAG: RHS repeat-associated core domain-containing protein, partial [Opitutales bacterium]|nr:RHS repeat-associated core domain-containing protein [Opitutales bacterium]